MSTTRSHTVTQVRRLAALAALAVVVDAASVGAPGLGLLAVPFLVVAIGFRDAHRPTRYLAAAWCVLDLVIGVNFAIANGFDAPWGDIVGVYVGGLVVLALLVTLFVPAATLGAAQRSVNPA